MDPINEWLRFKRLGEKIDKLADNLLKVAEETWKLPPPEKLRPATPEDVVVGAILWYTDFDDSRYWNRVEEVHCPTDLWKAYSAHDGCRYGLENAFVEIKNDENLKKSS